ncbi:MAG: GNAT family N-acetyltransferase [Myxococcales bacterium]|nr:GNAT family N-acetyltransferase [Myxococcales bacterium]
MPSCGPSGVFVRHELSAAGPGYSLRPVTLDDAETLVALRARGERTRYLNAVSPDPEAQRDWLRRYFEREGDWYFAIVRNDTGATEGFVGLYDLSVGAGGREAEWGRWILREGSLAAAASALLVYRVAFSRLGLDALYCRTVADNAAVVSFHDRCGCRLRRVLPGAITLDGQPFDAVEHRFEAADLATLEASLSPLATRIAGRLGAPR